MPDKPPDKLPDALFEPPPEGKGATASSRLEVEEGWAREKAARQAAAVEAARPHARTRMIVGTLVGVLLVGVVATVMVIIGSQPASHDASEATPASTRPDVSNAVLIEVRAKPPARVKLDGRAVGKTPLALRVPRRLAPVTIEAQIGTHTFARQIVPDHDQTIDFTTRH